MRAPLVLAIVAAAALVTLNACSSDSGAPLAPEPTSSAQAGGNVTLVVDDDEVDCPQAGYTSIQRAVDAAQPGDKILVCRGIYSENVLVEKADLRIEAQGAPGEVVLQGQGTTGQPYGFHLSNATGVLVQGFRVQGYTDANIIVDRGSGNTIRKNVTTAGVVDGIEVLNSSGNVIEHNVSFANTGERADGIFVEGASDNVIRHNETFGNGQHGINLFESGTGNVLFGNSSHDNRVRGIQVGQSNGTVIDNNRVFANGLIPIPPVPGVPPVLGVGIGIFVVNSTGVTVRNNRSELNGSTGIALNAAGSNVVSNNRSESNRTVGIGVNAASNDNLVEKNEVFRNGQDGIRLQNNADRNTVRLNQVVGHARDGIRVSDATSERNTIERNVIRDSGEHDAHDESVSPDPNTPGPANVWLKNHCETQNRPRLCEHPVGTP